MDKRSTGGMVIPPLPVQERGIHHKSAWDSARNEKFVNKELPKEWDSAL
jgi:hypothetical protein